MSALREANKTRQAEWDVDNQITLSYRGNELAGEVGEACNVIKKLDRERMGIRGSRDTVEHLAEELADVVICADLIAMAAGIDLDAAVARKFNATSRKGRPKNSNGNPPMKIYLAGKMRGLPNFGHQAFRDGAAKLRAEGHEVFSPVESTESIYGPDVYTSNPEGDELRAGIDGRLVFGLDLNYICQQAEAVALLPGWETSKGAQAERAVAIALGLELLLL